GELGRERDVSCEYCVQLIGDIVPLWLSPSVDQLARTRSTLASTAATIQSSFDQAVSAGDTGGIEGLVATAKEFDKSRQSILGASCPELIAPGLQKKKAGVTLNALVSNSQSNVFKQSKVLHTLCEAAQANVLKVLPRERLDEPGEGFRWKFKLGSGNFKDFSEEKCAEVERLYQDWIGKGRPADDKGRRYEIAIQVRTDSSVGTKAGPVPRDRCKYGAECFRKNVEHRRDFCHPNDWDWSAQEDLPKEPPPAPPPTESVGEADFAEIREERFSLDFLLMTQVNLSRRVRGMRNINRTEGMTVAQKLTCEYFEQVMLFVKEAENTFSQAEAELHFLGGVERSEMEKQVEGLVTAMTPALREFLQLAVFVRDKKVVEEVMALLGVQAERLHVADALKDLRLSDVLGELKEAYAAPGLQLKAPKRSGLGQSYGGGLPLSEFNKLVPPGWRPGIPGYPIKLFFERLKLWYRVTDNAEAQLGILVAGRLQGAPQKIALLLRLPRPVAAGGGYDIGDEALIRLSQEQVIDPANNTIVQEYIPSGLQFLCQALRAIYGLQDQDRTTVALDSFYEFKRGHLGLAEFAQEFDHRYESAEDEAGLQMNDTGKTYFFLRGSGLGDKSIEDIKLQMRGDMSKYQEIRTLVLKLARANDKDKETLNMYQDQTDFNYKVNLDETNGNYYGSWHDPSTGEIIEYDYGANTSDDMYYGDYDYVYDGEYSDYDGAGYDDDWYGDDGWQDEVYHGDFPLEEWTWPASAPDSSAVSTAETTLLDVDPSYWKGQTKGKGKGFGAKGKGPSGGSASGIGCATCGSRWHSSLDCPLNDPSKGDQGKGKGGKDHHYENFWKGKGKGKKGGKSKGFGKGWSKGFGKYRPSFGSGKGYGKYSGGYGKSYGQSYGKGKFKGGYGGFRYSSPYNFTAFQDYEVQDAPEHAPTIAFKADGSGTQYYDFEDEQPSSSTRPPPQSTTEPMIDADGNFGYNDGYGELDTATALVPDVRVNALSFLVGTCSSAFPTDHEDWSSLYHSVRGVKRHGLLIDPGAASGLIGSDTLKEFRDEILLPLGVDIICRPTTQNVSGISGKPEPALSRVTMPIFTGIKSSTFTADVIGKQGSKCPALLPNPSMRAANMGLLTNFFENGDGMLIVHNNGKRLLYRCLLTESGHYILPTDNVKNNNNVDKEATRKASAFYAAVLRDATQQWSDISSVYLAVDKAAVAETMIDHP
ncbi:unnamed protein product, partial [Polarella glacialis]